MHKIISKYIISKITLLVRKDMSTVDVIEEDATDLSKWRQKCGKAKYRLGYKWPWK